MGNSQTGAQELTFHGVIWLKCTTHRHCKFYIFLSFFSTHFPVKCIHNFTFQNLR